MIWEEYKNTIIVSCICVVTLVMLIVFIVFDFKIGPFKIASVNSILSQHDKVSNSENDLITKETAYKSDLKKLEFTKDEFKNQKLKYESISDDTINVIKEATTQEEYSIEYMWIRLGNHARVSNVSLVLLEPGGTQNDNSDVSTGETNSEDETTNTASANEESNINTASNSNSTTSSDTDVSEESALKDTEKNQEMVASSDGSNMKDQMDLSENLSSSLDGLFKIEVTGSYMNVSDFIFAVENDSVLRFKLDNILMECVSGTTIKATFDVKNIIIKK